MRPPVALLIVLAACGNPSPAPEPVASNEAPITDLHFRDPQLETIAAGVTRRAGSMAVETSSGRNRVERLIALEAAVGGGDRALTRANQLVTEMTVTDVSQWAELRQRAERDFAGRDDEVGGRIRDLLARWQRRKSEEVFQYLSSNYQSTYITSLEWERRFHDFVKERPFDAATWGWLVLREYSAEAQQQFGKATSETAYRFYLVYSGLGDGREARRIFSVPGVEIQEPPVFSPAPRRPRFRL